jgi:hypothetical protein
VTIDAPPPPSPPERAAARLRFRRRLRVGALLLVALLGLALLLSERSPFGREAGMSASDRQEALMALLDGIERSELAMETFNDVLAEAIAEASTSEEVRAAVTRIAREGGEQLREVRVELVPLAEDAAVDAVRDAYLPHLDAWADFMRAVEERPELLFDPAGQQPFLLLINATATTFREATEAMIAAGPGEEVAERADAILTRGFRGFEGEADL